MHECDADGYAQLCRIADRRQAAAVARPAGASGSSLALAITLPWLAAQDLRFMPTALAPAPSGPRRQARPGHRRGQRARPGRDARMPGARRAVIGTVRSEASRDALLARAASRHAGAAAGCRPVPPRRAGRGAGRRRQSTQVRWHWRCCAPASSTTAPRCFRWTRCETRSRSICSRPPTSRAGCAQAARHRSLTQADARRFAADELRWFWCRAWAAGTACIRRPATTRRRRR